MMTTTSFLFRTMQRHKKLLLKCFYGTCALLVVNALIFDYYRPNFTVNDILPDDNADIERTIEQMPTCTPADRPRHRALLYTLQAWSEFARQHGIQYWIAYGSVVGYVQRRGLLPHDLDVDLFVMAQDSSRLFELSQLNFSSLYQLVVHPQWYIVEEAQRSYFPSEGINFVAPNARFINVPHELHVDIWPIYDYHPNGTRLQKGGKPMLTEYDKAYEWKSSPKEWTFPLQECTFSRIRVWCPAKPHKLVASMYGEFSLRIPARACENGSWEKTEEYRAARELMRMNEQTTSASQPEDVRTTEARLDDDALIESALEKISTCTADDRSRQRTLLATLRAWSRIAQEYKIQYWLTLRSLVGYVQHRSLSPYDSDLQIAVMVNDTPQLMNISQSNFSSTYQLKIHPQWNITGAANRSRFPERGIDFVAPNARFIHLQTNYHLDILPSYSFNPSSPNGSNAENLTVYDANYQWLSYPRAWTYPLQTCYVSEIEVLCPAKPETIVETMFGAKAKTEPEKKCENGTWVDNNRKETA